MHHRALWRLFFVRPLLLRAGDVTDFPETWKQMQRVRQNEETEECMSQMKEQDKVTARDLSEMEKVMSLIENLK